MIERSIDLAQTAGTSPPTLEARPSPNPSVTATKCLHCEKEFAPKPNQKFCSNACRQKAYRLSPAHRKSLQGQKHQRMNRRNDWTKRRRAYMSLAFDGRHSGSIIGTVPALGSINPKQFSKVAGQGVSA